MCFSLEAALPIDGLGLGLGLGDPVWTQCHGAGATGQDWEEVSSWAAMGRREESSEWAVCCLWSIAASWDGKAQVRQCGVLAWDAPPRQINPRLSWEGTFPWKLPPGL